MELQQLPTVDSIHKEAIAWNNKKKRGDGI